MDVEATSEQDAVNEVLDGCGDLIHTEYSYTPDNDAVHHVSCKEDIMNKEECREQIQEDILAYFDSVAFVHSDHGAMTFAKS